MKVVLANVEADLSKEQVKEAALRLVRDHYQIPPNVFFIGRSPRLKRNSDSLCPQSDQFYPTTDQAPGICALQALEAIPTT